MFVTSLSRQVQFRLCKSKRNQVEFFLQSFHHHHRRSLHRFCVIGSGPAGFYAAQHLLKLDPACKVDIYEKLPVPFGLVRYGVAPDHPEVKNVINTFTNVLKHKNVTFVGNFEAGKDVTLAQLRNAYHGILLAYGASEDRKLGIPGEKEHVISAREFVGWYNGLPENRNLSVDFRNKSRAVIIGQGNVALDIARILLSSVEVLSKTDISPYALNTLEESSIKEVVICGRRGPMQVSFTIKELRELYNLQNVHAVSDVQDFKHIDEDFIKELPRPRRRLTELMWKSANSGNNKATDVSSSNKTWFLKFFRSPLKVEKVSDRLSLTLAINKFDEVKKDQVVPTGETEVDECDVVFRSVGYKGRRIFMDLPFDERTGVIPNEQGKVETGIYCCGWAGQGPQGVILTTMQNAFDVAKKMITDIKEDEATTISKAGYEEIHPLLSQKRVTHYEDFAKIAEFEAQHNRKVTSIDEMFQIINGKL